jgi:hypothetical protein
MVPDRKSLPKTLVAIWMKLHRQLDQKPVAPKACFTFGWKRYQRIHA